MGEPVTQAVQVRIEGLVQGVFYRGWTIENAVELGCKGWVRNRRDGSVEALFVGPRAAIDEMLARCAEGPPAARVAAVLPSDVPPPDPLPRDFRGLPTV